MGVMKVFKDELGNSWVAKAIEEATPRHHGKWYLVFHPEHDPAQLYDVPTIRWQTEATAARTLETISDFELRRRVKSAQLQNSAGPVTHDEAEYKAPRVQTNVNSG
jgi:hypothetical protein